MVYQIIQYLAIVSGLSAQRLWCAACAVPSARLLRMAVLGCVIFGQLLTPAWAATLAHGQAPSRAKAQQASTALSGPIYPSNQHLTQVNPARAAIDLIVRANARAMVWQAVLASQKAVWAQSS